jgi:hypothetical protein
MHTDARAVRGISVINESYKFSLFRGPSILECWSPRSMSRCSMNCVIGLDSSESNRSNPPITPADSKMTMFYS